MLMFQFKLTLLMKNVEVCQYFVKKSLQQSIHSFNSIMEYCIVVSTETVLLVVKFYTVVKKILKTDVSDCTVVLRRSESFNSKWVLSRDLYLQRSYQEFSLRLNDKYEWLV